MKIKAAILVTSFAVLLFVVVGSMGGVHASSSDGSYRQLQVYSEVLSRVRSEYVEEPNIPKVTDGALHGLLESLDSNSSYLSADAYKAFKAHRAEGKADIGAVISKRFGYAAVVAVLPGSPAEKAGIETTDIFESIEGQSTRELSLPEIRNLIVGAQGSNLNVEVVRARKAEPQKISITRDVVGIFQQIGVILDEPVRTLAFGLFVGNREKDDVAIERNSLPLQHDHHDELGKSLIFHILSAASPQIPVPELAAKRRHFPMRGIAGDHVDVVQQNDRSGVAHVRTI